ncbi:MAG: hypothetical protein QOG31_1060 [Thermoplasmata archaeon]|nr:hypothetical protein [Thermoplasmata archaeon]
MPWATLRHALGLLDCGAVVRRDIHHFDVASLREPGRFVRVYWVGRWRCRADKHNDEDAPCCHVLAVLMHAGLVPRPGAQAWNHAEGKRRDLEAQAWATLPARLPGFLERFVREGVYEPPPPATGRPPKPLMALVHEALARAAFRRLPEAEAPANPFARVGRSTLARFQATPATVDLLSGLLELSWWPARPFDVPGPWVRLSLERFFEDAAGPILEAQARWSERYGVLTALRFEPPQGEPEAPAATLAAWKASVGVEVLSQDATAQRVEAFCMAIAYNLGRLAVLGLERGLEIQFAGGLLPAPAHG